MGVAALVKINPTKPMIATTPVGKTNASILTDHAIAQFTSEFMKDSVLIRPRQARLIARL